MRFGLAKSAVQTRLHQSPGRDTITQKKKRVICLVFYSLFPSTFLFPFPVPPVIVGKEPGWCKHSPPPALREREAWGQLLVAQPAPALTTAALSCWTGRWASDGGVGTSDCTSPACSPQENWPFSHKGLTAGPFPQPGLSLSQELERVWRGLGWRSPCCSYSLPSHFHFKYFS